MSVENIAPLSPELVARTAAPRSCLAQPEHVRGQVLEAFGCWLRLSGGRGLPDGFEAHPLVAAAAVGLRSEASFHQAVDAVSGRRLAVLAVGC
jgi:hypothetical protein